MRNDDAKSISIHALREEGDIDGVEVMDDVKIFLSTPSARRATAKIRVESKDAMKFLSTPSARRATSRRLEVRFNGLHFYPRPPRGGRRRSKCRPTLTCIFLSTPSARRATLPQRRANSACVISIHALREEGDRSTSRYSTR